MLAVAWRERNRGEAVGQIIRLVVAAPGSALGKYPEGNNGRAAVPLTPTDAGARRSRCAARVGGHRVSETDAAVIRTVALTTRIAAPC